MRSAVQACFCWRWYFAVIGPLHQGGHLIAELDPEDLVRPLARLHGRPDDLGLPEGRLRLGHPAQGVALDAQQPQGRGLVEAGLHPECDELGVRQLLVADPVVGQRRGRSGGFADLHQQIDRHAGPLGEPGDRDVAERREALEGGCVEEVEREHAAPHRGAQRVERDARGDKAADHARRGPLHACRPAAPGTSRQCRRSSQSAGTRPAGPGAGWSAGYACGGARTGPSKPSSVV